MSWELIAAAIAVGATLLSHAKAIWSRVTGLLFVKHRCTEHSARVVLSFLGGDSGRIRAYNSTRTYFVKPLEKVTRVFWQERAYTEGATYWYRHLPVWMDREKDAPMGFEYCFTTLRWTVDFEALLIEAAEWEERTRDDVNGEIRHRVIYHHGRTLGGELAQQKKDESTRTYKHNWDKSEGDRLLRWQESDVGSSSQNTIEGLALMPNIKALVVEIRRWFGLRQWYSDHLIAWRRGYALTGIAGTGKTTIVREIAAELDLPVHIMDIATMSNEDLRSAWDEAQADSPCVVLIEDMDAVFVGRENVAKPGGLMSSGGLTFDCLLNCIDGVQRADGILLFATTNHVDKLDEALTRPGRLDRTVEFLPLDFERRHWLAERILGKGACADRVAIESGDMSAAAFTEMCCRLAIEDAYASKEPHR